MSLVQHADPYNNEQDGSSADKYHVCVTCDFTAGNPPNALREVTAIERVEANHIATELAPILEEILKKHAAECNCQAAAQTAEYPASCYSYDCNVIHIRTAPIEGSTQKFVPVTLFTHVIYTEFVVIDILGSLSRTTTRY